MSICAGSAVSPDNDPRPASTVMTRDESTKQQTNVPDDSGIRSLIAPPEVSEHDTLKYHLLGPSLTKAGQDKVDQQKVELFSH